MEEMKKIRGKLFSYRGKEKRCFYFLGISAGRL
jgi:hypothetical protein